MKKDKTGKGMMECQGWHVFILDKVMQEEAALNKVKE